MEDIQFGREPDPEQVAAARAQAAELMYLYNTGYVLLYPPIPARKPYEDHWEAAWAFVKATLPLEETPFWSADGIEAYRVVQPAGTDTFRIDLGEADTYPYRGEGWDAAAVDTVYDLPAIWATDATSRVFVPLRGVDPAATYRVSLKVQPFAYPGAPDQQVRLTVNGTDLDTQPLAATWQTLTWSVPGSALVDGLNRVELHWGYAAVPRVVVGGSRAIGSTGVQLPVDADVKAFADGGFIALFDGAGDQTDGSAGRRGFNVTVLDPVTGAVVDKTGFDTAANVYESDALAAYLAAVAPGQIVVVASYGEAWAYLTPEAVAAFQGIGLGVTPEDLQGNYLAGIGVQGAATGTGVWTVHPQDAFVSVSLNRDRRSLAAAVDWIEVGPAR